jgi:type I restriction enzyme M protein
MPPDKNADYAFVLHIIKSMNSNGRAGIVLPHGVLFRGGAEGKIREQILKNDLVEAVIGLPTKLFYGTGIPAAILILNKNKPEEHKSKVLIIDAEKDYLEGKNQNSLRKQDIDKIILTYNDFASLPNYSQVVEISEIVEKDYNLNIRHYIESTGDHELIDIRATHRSIKILEEERVKIEAKIDQFLTKLNY